MLEMIVFAVILGVTLVLCNFIAGAIATKVYTSEKYLKSTAEKFMGTYMTIVSDMFSKEDEEDKKIEEIKRQIFEED